MRLLFIHADRFQYKVVSKAIENPEPLEGAERESSFQEVLVVFTTVEEPDERSPGEVAGQAVENVLDVVGRLGARKVVIYPYAHLSSHLASPSASLSILKAVEEGLKASGIDAHRSPFGWYKAFTVACKGHPLSELSRSVTPEAEELKLKREEVGKAEGAGRFTRFILLGVDGEEYEVTPQNWRDCPIFAKPGHVFKLLWTFVRNELEGNPPKGSPKHIDYMRKLELIDYCPESDVGNFKLYPNGVLIFDLIKDYALYNVAMPWGAMKIQNPLIYRQSVKEIRELMGEFHERDYGMEFENEAFVLRFSSDPGAFPYMQKAGFSYRHLPVKVYEEVPCFRRELSGELVGLRRLRHFTMTDQHCFCGDEEQAREEFERLCLMFKDLMDNVIAKGNWVLGWEGVESFYEPRKEWLKGLGVKMGVPAFFKLTSEMTHYYAIKNEYQAIGADEANVQVSTVQYDVKNGERFGIGYVGEDGKKHPCIILHASSFGSIERTLYAILETAAKDEERGRAPMLPLWLSPDQIRLIPVAERHLEKCREISEKLSREKTRVSLDDRNLSVSRRVMEAKTSWVPYIIVVGDKEMQGETLPVVIRERSSIKEEFRQNMILFELIEETRSKCKDMPFRPSYVPVELSRRVTFVPWGR